MKIRTAILLLAALGASVASAERKNTNMSPSKFDHLLPSDMSADGMFYSDYRMPFAQWQETRPDEAALLNIYPNYVEPTVTEVVEGKTTGPKVEHVWDYVARTKTVLNIAPEKINLAATFSDLNKLKSLDPAVQVTPITAAQTMPNLVTQHLPITSFAICQRNGSSLIQRPKDETDLSHLNGHQFCEGKGKLCFESCLLLSEGYAEKLVKFSSQMKMIRPIDRGIAFQSELVTYKSENEFGNQIPLKNITHIDTLVIGIVKQNMFYFNQIFEEGTLVSVLQRHPTDPTKTIMTSFLVMGVKQRSIDKYTEKSITAPDPVHGGTAKLVVMPALKDVLQQGLGEEQGMMAGVPVYTIAMTKQIAVKLETSEVPTN